MKITPEAVKERIAALESAGELSLKEQFYLEALRLLVAGMDSEPVAWTSETALSDVACEETSMIGQEGVVGSIPLYRHAQQPVVPEIDRKAIADKVYGKCSRIPGATFYNAAEFAIDEVEVCRAAMIQAVPLTNEGDIALHNYRTALEGIGHIRRTLEETFGGLHGTHVEPDVLMDCKTICDAIYAAYSGKSPAIPDSCTWHCEEDINNWHSDCGYQFQFTEDGPEENGVKFCPKCGKSVAVSATEGTEE